MKKSLVILLTIVMMLSIFSLGVLGADESTKVGVLLPGNINDSGWNASVYEGLMTAGEKYDIKVNYMESVAQSDFEEAFRNYAVMDYDLVIGHGYQFQKAAKKVAESYPETYFAILNGSTSMEPNLASYQFTNWQPGYLSGVLAGLITENDHIGAIGGQEIPVISDALEAFKDGVHRVNPEAKVVITYVDTWSDVAKGKETASAMIENGADVVVTNANAVGLGSIEACKEAGVYAIGFVNDQHDVAPDTVVASGIQSNQKLVLRVIEDYLNDEFSAGIYNLGIAEGVEGLSPFYNWEDKLPEEVINKVNEVEQKIIEGEITWSSE
ncbi:MAG: BMP family protein [Halanaerobiales bacterium]|nr:BMP family protein [Halanaerobiales bacterium]